MKYKFFLWCTKWHIAIDCQTKQLVCIHCSIYLSANALIHQCFAVRSLDVYPRIFKQSLWYGILLWLALHPNLKFCWWPYNIKSLTIMTILENYLIQLKLWHYSSEEPWPIEAVATRWQCREPWGKQALSFNLNFSFRHQILLHLNKQVPYEAGWIRARHWPDTVFLTKFLHYSWDGTETC